MLGMKTVFFKDETFNETEEERGSPVTSDKTVRTSSCWTEPGSQLHRIWSKTHKRWNKGPMLPEGMLVSQQTLNQVYTKTFYDQKWCRWSCFSVNYLIWSVSIHRMSSWSDSRPRHERIITTKWTEFDENCLTWLPQLTYIYRHTNGRNILRITAKSCGGSWESCSTQAWVITAHHMWLWRPSWIKVCHERLRVACVVLRDAWLL